MSRSQGIAGAGCTDFDGHQEQPGTSVGAVVIVGNAVAWIWAVAKWSVRILVDIKGMGYTRKTKGTKA